MLNSSPSVSLGGGEAAVCTESAGAPARGGMCVSIESDCIPRATSVGAAAADAGDGTSDSSSSGTDAVPCAAAGDAGTERALRTGMGMCDGIMCIMPGGAIMPNGANATKPGSVRGARSWAAPRGMPGAVVGGANIAGLGGYVTPCIAAAP